MLFKSWSEIANNYYLGHQPYNWWPEKLTLSDIQLMTWKMVHMMIWHFSVIWIRLIHYSNTQCNFFTTIRPLKRFYRNTDNRDNILVKRSIPTVCFAHKGINPSTRDALLIVINKVNKCITCKQSWILLILLIKYVIAFH